MYHAIETNCLILRPPQLGDDKPVNEAINRSLPELQRWMPWASDPSLEPTANYIHEGIKSWSSKHAKEYPIIVIHKKI